MIRHEFRALKNICSFTILCYIILTIQELCLIDQYLIRYMKLLFNPSPIPIVFQFISGYVLEDICISKYF